MNIDKQSTFFQTNLKDLEMNAGVQYNDFKGSAAADISGSGDLNDFINSRGIDINRYNAIGVELYSGENNDFSGSIICIDKEKSGDQKPYIVKISFEAEFSIDEFFKLFKRFNVIITKSAVNFKELEIDEEFYFDDRVEME